MLDIFHFGIHFLLLTVLGFVSIGVTVTAGMKSCLPIITGYYMSYPWNLESFLEELSLVVNGQSFLVIDGYLQNLAFIVTS